MDDAGARGHQIDRAGADHLVGAQTVAVLDRAVEQIGDGGEIDVRVGADVHAAAGRQTGGAELVDEDERSDHRPRPGRKRAADLEVAEIMGDGDDLDHGAISSDSLRPTISRLTPRVIRLVTAPPNRGVVTLTVTLFIFDKGGARFTVGRTRGSTI